METVKHVWDTINPEDYQQQHHQRPSPVTAVAPSDEDDHTAGDGSAGEERGLTPRELIYQWWIRKQANETHGQYQAPIPWGSLCLYNLNKWNQDDIFSIRPMNWINRFREYCAILFYFIDEDNQVINVLGIIAIYHFKKLTQTNPDAIGNAFQFMGKNTWPPRDWVVCQGVDISTIQAGRGQRIHDCSVAIDQLEAPGSLPNKDRVSRLVNEQLPRFEQLVIQLDKLIQKYEALHRHRSPDYWLEFKALVKEQYLAGMDFALVEHRVLDYCLRRHLLYYVLCIEKEGVWQRLAEVAAHLLQCIVSMCWPHEHLIVEFLKMCNMNTWMIDLSEPHLCVHQALTGWSCAWKQESNFRSAALSMFGTHLHNGGGGTAQHPSKKRMLLRASDNRTVTPVSSRFVTARSREECQERYQHAMQQAAYNDSLTLVLDNDTDHQVWEDPVVPLSKRLKAPFDSRIVACTRRNGRRIWLLESIERLQEMELNNEDEEPLQQVLYDYLPTKMFFVYRQAPLERRQYLQENLCKAVRDYLIGTKEFSSSAEDSTAMDLILRDYRQYQIGNELTICVFNSLVFKTLWLIRTLLFQGDAIRFLPDSQNMLQEYYSNHAAVPVPFEWPLQPDFEHLQSAYSWCPSTSPRTPTTPSTPPTSSATASNRKEHAAVMNRVLEDFLRENDSREPPRFLWTRNKNYFSANPPGERQPPYEITSDNTPMYLLTYLDIPFFLGSRMRYYLHTVKSELRSRHNNSLSDLFRSNEGEFKVCATVGKRFVQLYLEANPKAAAAVAAAASSISIARSLSSADVPTETAEVITTVTAPVDQEAAIDGGGVIMRPVSIRVKAPAVSPVVSKQQNKRQRDDEEREKTARYRKTLREYANSHWEDYVIFLLGDRYASRTDAQIRYGAKGSFFTTLKGEYALCWKDTEHGISSKGSYPLTLYQLYSEEHNGHFEASMCHKERDKNSKPEVRKTKTGKTYTIFPKTPWQEIAAKSITADQIYERLEVFFKDKTNPEERGEYIRDADGMHAPRKDDAKYEETMLKKIEDAKQEMKEMHANTLSIKGFLAQEYLRQTRGIRCLSEHVLEESPYVRYSSALDYYHQRDPVTGVKRPKDVPPAVIFFAVNKQRELVGCQRIYLDAKTKGKIMFENQILDSPKRSKGPLAAANAFCCVQYGRLDKLPCVYLAEGPETALSVAAASPYMRVYTSFGIGNFKRFDFDLRTRWQDSPSGISCPMLCLCLDRDKPKPTKKKKQQDSLTPPSLVNNNTAAETVKGAIATLRELGWTVITAMPEECDEPRPGAKADFNDVLCRQGVERVRDLLGVPQEARIRWFGETEGDDDEEEEGEQDPLNLWPANVPREDGTDEEWLVAPDVLCDAERVEQLRSRIREEEEQQQQDDDDVAEEDETE